MRIGIDATCCSNRRGFGRFARELLGAVAGLDTGDDFVLLADQQTAQQESFPPAWSVAVAQTSEAASIAASASGRRSIADMSAMRRLTANQQLDVVFFPAVYSYFPVAGDVPCVVTFHDVIAETLPHLVFDNFRSRLFWTLKSLLAVSRSSMVVTVSQASKIGLKREFGLLEDRVRVICEGPSPAFCKRHVTQGQRRERLNEIGLQSDERFALYVGGISPHKNLQTLIEAVAVLVKEDSYPNFRLVLVGDYLGDVFRTCHLDLVALARRLGVEDRIIFAGYVPDDRLVALYNLADVFVFPSYLEGFGLPAVEAMACGTPVMVSNRGSLPEVIADAGLLVDPHDPRAMASCLSHVLSDQNLRADLADRSLQRSKAHTWTRAAQQLMDILHEYKP